MADLSSMRYTCNYHAANGEGRTQLFRTLKIARELAVITTALYKNEAKIYSVYNGRLVETWINGEKVNA
jgi:hypothetical protein